MAGQNGRTLTSNVLVWAAWSINYSEARLRYLVLLRYRQHALKLRYDVIWVRLNHLFQ